MILELDISLLNQYGLNLNQLVFLSLVLNISQNKYQDIHELLSRVSDEDIQGLINRNLILETITNDEKIFKVTDELQKMLDQKASTMFDEFYNIFPVYVTRPDGTKGFLRTNKNKCKSEYNRIIGKSTEKHNYLLSCLKWELSNKAITGKIGYMKSMWKWLTQHEWECYDEQMQLDKQQTTTVSYGTTVL